MIAFERRPRRPLILFLTLPTSHRPPTPTPEMPLPKRNYGFEKRQKELAKQRKREEKRQRRAERNATDDPTAPDPDEDPDSPDSPDSPDTPAAQP